MYQESFTKLELEEIATILDILNPQFEGVDFDPLETTILAHDVSYYPGYRFFDIADHTVNPPLQRFAFWKAPDDYVVLTFSNEPIYALNKSLPIVLNEDNVAEYVRFFFTHVRGRHGRFIIAENVDDINWREDPPPSARKAIGQMIEPVTLQKSHEGSHDLVACMIFKDSLFRSKVKVDPQGFVSLSDEELLVEDMPVLDDTFGL